MDGIYAVDSQAEFKKTLSFLLNGDVKIDFNTEKYSWDAIVKEIEKVYENVR